MSTMTICKKCEEPAVPGRALCERHAAIQREYQARWVAKKAGGVVTTKPPRAIATQAATEKPDLVIETDTPGKPMDLDQAILLCNLELNTLMDAQQILLRMGRRC